MNHGIWVAAGIAALMLAGKPAHAAWVGVGDPLNVKAPGSVAEVTNASVLARKSDGTIWARQIAPNVGGAWVTEGSPSVGTSSGPAAVALNGADYYVVRGGDGNIWAKHGTSSWVNTFGAPPTGTLTAPSISVDGTSPNQEADIVVVDGNMLPWRRHLNSNGTLNAWQQISTNSALSVPAIAINADYEPYVYTLGAFAYTIFETCNFGSCWNNWQNFGGGVGNSGMAATSHIDPTTFDADIDVAVLGTNNIPYLSTSTTNGNSYSGFQSLGGSAADSSPTIVYVPIASFDYAAVHRPDGNYWICPGARLNNPCTWSSLGHP